MSQHPRPKFTYLGHATVRLRASRGRGGADRSLGPEQPGLPEALKKLDRLDAVLITHAHCDHMGDAVELAKTPQAEDRGGELRDLRLAGHRRGSRTAPA